MYLIYLIAGAIRVPNGSDKSEKSASHFYYQTQRRRDAKFFFEHGKHEIYENM